ncbi:MAG: GGDEF domain-containing protein [Polyangiaceae bacterium]|nr:GGDEF domain-containing protein [Polyangiaceae bacterium]
MKGDDDLLESSVDDERTAIVKLKDLGGQRAAAKDRHLLVRIQGEQVGQVVTLHGSEWKVGRARNADLWLGDSGVSRIHAHLVWSDGGYFVEDLGSANGTYVNGVKVASHAIADGDVVQFGPSAAFRYAVTDADQEAMLLQLYDASVTDSLTGAYNREHFDHRLEAEISFARRHGSELSLLLLDIDHFKLVNDTYGHQAGDTALVAMANAVMENLRTEDVFARYGGEEFAIILRGIDRPSAYHVGERFRIIIESLRIEVGGTIITVTVSVGAASLKCCTDETTEGLIATADRRLYAAKHAGRNRVVAQG